MNKFSLTLHETASSWRNLLDKRLKPLGLSQAKWRALLHISMTDKPLTQINLAQKLGVEGASVVGLVDRLEKEGWVNRIDDEADRRVRMIVLTEKARHTLEQIHDIANQLSEELLAPISLLELDTCMSVLEKIKHNIQKNI